MNRILIDEGLNYVTRKEDTLCIEIEQDMNLLINDSSLKYEIIVNNCNANILSVFENKKNTDIKMEINSSNVICNLISFNTEDQNVLVKLNSKNSSINIYNSVVSTNKQESNFNILHNAPNTCSNVYNCAVTMKTGSIKFNVTSRVFKDTDKCVINQDSKIISLNGSNENEINPNLLIDCYDTLASHAAFIGKFKDEDVFYMQTRGIKKKDAYNLLLEGFLIGKLDVSSSEKKYLSEKLNENWR